MRRMATGEWVGLEQRHQSLQSSFKGNAFTEPCDEASSETRKTALPVRAQLACSCLVATRNDWQRYQKASAHKRHNSSSSKTSLYDCQFRPDVGFGPRGQGNVKTSGGGRLLKILTGYMRAVRQKVVYICGQWL